METIRDLHKSKKVDPSSCDFIALHCIFYRYDFVANISSSLSASTIIMSTRTGATVRSFLFLASHDNDIEPIIFDRSTESNRMILSEIDS